VSETVTMTLTDFLLARIAEDEEVARRVGESWFRYFGQVYVIEGAGEGHPAWQAHRGDDRCQVRTEADGDHIARHDPARVLAECEAKRRIVEELRSITMGKWKAGEPWADRMLGILALPYADHPDYREEWKP
jgi:hypothetical protein